MTQPLPHLDAPGKGLPFFEGLYARYIMFPRAMRRYDGAASMETFRRESTLIADLAGSLSDDAFFTPVLIDRLPGIEDSSRFWSAAMVLEHLLMTMRPMTQIVETLAAGKEMKTRVSTADVKPKGGRTVARAEWLRLFTQAVSEVEARVAPLAVRADIAQPDRRAPKVYHPFFGEIAAKGWIWVIGAHQVTHRRQMQRILDHLKA